MIRSAAHSVVIIALLAPVVSVHAETPAAPAQGFDTLVAQYWDYHLSEAPDEATLDGDYRFNDKWPDWSLAHERTVRRISFRAMAFRHGGLVRAWEGLEVAWCTDRLPFRAKHLGARLDM